MKTDLRNLVTAEEAYFADSVYYTSNRGTNFAVTTGNLAGRDHGDRRRLERDDHQHQPGEPAAYVRDLHRQHVGRSGQQGRRAEVRLSLPA